MDIREKFYAHLESVSAGADPMLIDGIMKGFDAWMESAGALEEFGLGVNLSPRISLTDASETELPADAVVGGIESVAADGGELAQLTPAEDTKQESPNLLDEIIENAKKLSDVSMDDVWIQTRLAKAAQILEDLVDYQAGDSSEQQPPEEKPPIFEGDKLE
jgi:hypothetical protein